MHGEHTKTYHRLLEAIRSELSAARAVAEEANSRVANLEKQEQLLASLWEVANSIAEAPPAALAAEQEAMKNASQSEPESFSARVRSIAREAIATAGRPLNRMEILAAVKSSGLHLPEGNQARKISKVLSRDPGLRNERGRGYFPSTSDAI